MKQGQQTIFSQIKHKIVPEWRLSGPQLAFVLTCFMLGVTTLHCESASACSNETLRAELGSLSLANCRAYEMTTPRYKQGYPLVVSGYLSSYASDGSKVFLVGLPTLSGILGEGESVAFGSVYLDNRTGDGWQLTPLNPPLSQFIGQVLLQAEVESGATLWRQHTPEQSATTQELYLRLASGEYHRIGPLSTPSASTGEPSDVIEIGPHNAIRPLASTQDYGHVVLESGNPEDRWPFDHTQGNGPSLYEYSGTENSTPTLVNVTGGRGSTNLAGEEFDGECGAVLGNSSQNSKYNALSESGETIFFTLVAHGEDGCPEAASAPKVHELYARIHGAANSQSAAETVRISESQCTEECGVESGKNFEGASNDGEKVFFTSTQKLLNNASSDSNNRDDASRSSGCAVTRGENGCNLYEYDFGSPKNARLKLIAGGSEVRGVAAIAADGSRIYFVAKGDLAINHNEYGATAQPGEPNLYVYDLATAKATFIATLSNGFDERDWLREFSRPVETTGPGGRFLLFASARQGLTPDAMTSTEQLFEYDAETEELVRVSKAEEGFEGNTNNMSAGVELASVETFANQDGYSSDFKGGTNRLNISRDGKTVVFTTADELSPRAVSAEQGCLSVYEFFTAGDIGEGNVHLISNGRDAQIYKGAFCGAQFEAMDATGENILFATADPLLPSDSDGVQRDIYDARSDGGFPLELGEVPICDPTTCEGPTTTEPSVEVPPTTTQPGVTLSPRSLTTGPTKTSARKKRLGASSKAKLAKALRVCKSKSKKRQQACERRAHQRYGPKGTASKLERRGV